MSQKPDINYKNKKQLLSQSITESFSSSDGEKNETIYNQINDSSLSEDPNDEYPLDEDSVLRKRRENPKNDLKSNIVNITQISRNNAKLASFAKQNILTAKKKNDKKIPNDEKVKEIPRKTDILISKNKNTKGNFGYKRSISKGNTNSKKTETKFATLNDEGKYNLIEKITVNKGKSGIKKNIKKNNLFSKKFRFGVNNNLTFNPVRAKKLPKNNEKLEERAIVDKENTNSLNTNHGISKNNFQIIKNNNINIINNNLNSSIKEKKTDYINKSLTSNENINFTKLDITKLSLNPSLVKIEDNQNINNSPLNKQNNNNQFPAQINQENIINNHNEYFSPRLTVLSKEIENEKMILNQKLTLINSQSNIFQNYHNIFPEQLNKTQNNTFIAKLPLTNRIKLFKDINNNMTTRHSVSPIPNMKINYYEDKNSKLFNNVNNMNYINNENNMNILNIANNITEVNKINEFGNGIICLRNPNINSNNNKINNRKNIGNFNDIKLDNSDNRNNLTFGPNQLYNQGQMNTSRMMINNINNHFNITIPNLVDNNILLQTQNNKNWINPLVPYYQPNTYNTQSIQPNINNPQIPWIKNYGLSTLAGKDITGNHKTNQDSFVFKAKINQINDFNIFGVLDGHGPEGHFVSKYASEFIPSFLMNHPEIKNLNETEQIYQKLKDNNFQIITQAFIETDNRLRNVNFNAFESGSTCVLIIHIGSHIICANTGDSRAIVVFNENANNNINEFQCLPLSIDFKPEIREEANRIFMNGGEVRKMRNEYGQFVGPYRVWARGENYPGLAMSRSIGDLKGKNIGVIPDPGILEYKLCEKTKYIVVCSDGVWEFLNNEKVRDIGKRFYLENNPNGFCQELINQSLKLWEQNDIVVDDITAVAAFF